MSDTEPLDGFYQRYPSDFCSWRELVDLVEAVAREHGFKEINTPSVERQALGEDKWSEAWDIIYTFDDPESQPVCLICEETPTRARMIQHHSEFEPPVKWFDTSKRWRHDEIRVGRDREFFQTDFDIFGVESAEADAEIIACAAIIYQRLGMADDVVFCINNRKLLRALVESLDLSFQVVLEPLFEKEDLTPEEFIERLVEGGVDSQSAEQLHELTDVRTNFDDSETIRELAPDSELGTEGLAEIEEVREYLDAYGVLSMCEFDSSITRAEFYTGTVFEAFDSEKRFPALFGGGRYDDLVGHYGEHDVPAVGFGFGYSMTVELMQRTDNWTATAKPTDAVVVSNSRAGLAGAIEFADRLRDTGAVVEVYSPDVISTPDLKSYADSVGAGYAVVAGSDSGTIRLIDIESGTEETVETAEAIDRTR